MVALVQHGAQSAAQFRSGYDLVWVIFGLLDVEGDGVVVHTVGPHVADDQLPAAGRFFDLGIALLDERFQRCAPIVVAPVQGELLQNRQELVFRGLVVAPARVEGGPELRGLDVVPGILIFPLVEHVALRRLRRRKRPLNVVEFIRIFGACVNLSGKFNGEVASCARNRRPIPIEAEIGQHFLCQLDPLGGSVSIRNAEIQLGIELAGLRTVCGPGGAVVVRPLDVLCKGIFLFDCCGLQYRHYITGGHVGCGRRFIHGESDVTVNPAGRAGERVGMEYGADFIAILHTGNQVPQPIPKAFLDAGDGQGELQILSHSGGFPDHGLLRQPAEGQEFRISAQEHIGFGAAVAQLVTPTVSGEGETLRDRQIDRIGLILFPDGKLYRVCNVGILTVQLQICQISGYPYQRIHAVINQHRLRIDGHTVQ